MTRRTTLVDDLNDALSELDVEQDEPRPAAPAKGIMTAFRATAEDRRAWNSAASLEGVTFSEFVRLALNERVEKILGRQ